MKKLVLILAIACLPCFLAAQTASSIKSDPSYLWAEGTGRSRSEADAAALDGLVSRLAASRILAEGYSDPKAIWHTYLQDIKKCSKVYVSSSGTVLRYIARKDIPSIFSDRWRKVGELVKSAESCETKGEMDKARTYSVWAQIYLLSLPPGGEALWNKVYDLMHRLGPGNASAVKLRNVETETLAIRRALKAKRPVRSAEKPPVEPVASQVLIEEKAARNSEALPPVEVLEPVLDSIDVCGKNLASPQTPTTAPVSFETKTNNTFMVLALSDAGRVPAFGLGIAWLPGKIGPYASARSNFASAAADYSCLGSGATDFGFLWASGNVRSSRHAVSAGAVISLNRFLGAFCGAGYGSESVLWEDTSGQWARVEDMSCKGIMAEAGLTFTAGRFAFCLGVSSIRFAQASVLAGAGISF